ncbi:MAG: hypothetical protein BWZ07_02630 [Alphaproteobacteria bacterium ADurb.BinA280]|nr:MAG: hypothetical protein BWZ07_02630 [Alphaproteobacteria bacterium ADurb.BinA280]
MVLLDTHHGAIHRQAKDIALYLRGLRHRAADRELQRTAIATAEVALRTRETIVENADVRRVKGVVTGVDPERIAHRQRRHAIRRQTNQVALQQDRATLADNAIDTELAGPASGNAIRITAATDNHVAVCRIWPADPDRPIEPAQTQGATGQVERGRRATRIDAKPVAAMIVAQSARDDRARGQEHRQATQTEGTGVRAGQREQRHPEIDKIGAGDFDLELRVVGTWGWNRVRLRTGLGIAVDGQAATDRQA